MGQVEQRACCAWIFAEDACEQSAITTADIDDMGNATKIHAGY